MAAMIGDTLAPQSTAASAGASGTIAHFRLRETAITNDTSVKGREACIF